MLPLVLAPLLAADVPAPEVSPIPPSPRPLVPLASDSLLGLPLPAARPIPPPEPVLPQTRPTGDSAARSPHWDDGPDPSQGLHGRLGVLLFAHGAGLQLGGLLRHRWLVAGLDGWIRPWAWTREVRLSPGRRMRVQELLYGVAPWISFEIPLGGPDGRAWSIAPVASFDLVGGTWYGTERAPTGDVGPSLGARVSTPSPLGLGLRRSFGRPELAGAWKGELTCEF